VASTESASTESAHPLATRSIIRVRVRFGETDLMGIAHHASYVTYLEVARVEWLRRRGVTYAAWAERGIHLPVVELTLAYRAPARFDDELDIQTSLGEIRAASVRFDYRIVRAPDDVLCAEGTTRLACVDATHAVRRFSAEMIAALEKDERF
jgi:acyl-CoA thioester hydrolase